MGDQTFADEMSSGLDAQAGLAQGLLAGHRANGPLGEGSLNTVASALSARSKAVSKTPLSSRPIKIITLFMMSSPLPGRKIMQTAFLKRSICATCLLFLEVEEVAVENMISVGKVFCFLLPLLKCYWGLFLIS